MHQEKNYNDEQSNVLNRVNVSFRGTLVVILLAPSQCKVYTSHGTKRFEMVVLCVRRAQEFLEWIREWKGDVFHGVEAISP